MDKLPPEPDARIEFNDEWIERILARSRARALELPFPDKIPVPRMIMRLYRQGDDDAGTG